MKRRVMVFIAALSVVLLLNPCALQAASPKGAGGNAATPQPGGVFKVLIKNAATRFGYPPTIIGPDRDFASPFFNRLITIGDDGK